MITIKRLRIQDNPANEVTSEKVFKPHKIKDANGNLCFHEEGIFSKRIFGQFGRCECGALTKPGICKYCGVRVLNKKKMPDFYISFEGLLDIPYLDCDLDFADKKIVKALLNYEGFMYDGEYVKFDMLNIDLTTFDTDKVLIGKDALLSLGCSEEWYNNQVHYKLSIPHTSLRKITYQNGQYFLGTLNTLFVDILKYKKTLNYYTNLNVRDIFYELNIKQYLLRKINEMYEELFNMMAKTKKSVIAREIIGQGLTGIIRAVITNNFSLDEDIALIGKYFIKTLYPKLYDQFTEDGVTDIDGLNKYLVDNGYYVLLNRQPTIGAKSIMGMVPRFSTKDDEKYVLQLNPIIMSGLSGDYDGDTLSIIALYTKAACQEAKKLLPSRNYIEGSNGSIRNGLPEDFVYVMEKLYDEGKEDVLEKYIRSTDD